MSNDEELSDSSYVGEENEEVTEVSVSEIKNDTVYSKEKLE